MSKKTDKTLNKCEELITRLNDLKKALMDTNVSSNRKPVNALGAGWSSDPSTGALHHSSHGIISTMKHPEGHYEIKHGGRSVGRAADPTEAGHKIKQYVKTLQPGDTGMHNTDPMALSEDGVEKSGYGPRGGGQYSAADNARRKANNTGSAVGSGPNVNVKAYSSKPGQLSAKQQAARAPHGAASPVKQYTPEQIAAMNEARKLKKTVENAPWVTHSSVPNADEEVTKLKKNNPVIPGEDAMANQLANMMQGKAMLNPDHRQPTSEDMIMAGERMGLGANPELIKKSDKEWGGAINNWLAEACKPISSRFASQEEEEAYWASIKVSDRDDGKSGY